MVGSASISGLLMLMTMSLGGLGLPVGLPPGEEDPQMAKIAPEECALYLSWSPMATPDAKSKNQTEQLLAEKEIQTFIKQIETAIVTAIERNAGPGPEGMLAAEVPTLLKTLLTHSTAIYVGEVNIGAGGVQVDAGVMVNTDENAEAVKASVTRLEVLFGSAIEEVKVAGYDWQKIDLPKGAPSLLWGFQGKYFIIGAGEASIEGIMKRTRGEAPKWLTDLKEQLPVPRRSSVAYLNVKKLLEISAPFTAGEPMMRTVLAATGLENITYLASVSGLDDEGMLTRSLIGLNGKPQGIFTLAGGKPLTAKDLAPIPQDATLAMAMRIDPEKIFRTLRGMIGKIDPRVQDEFDRELEQIADQLNLDLSEDLFKPLGDTWRIYNSPSEGGLVITGLTGVVSVRDHDRLAKTLVKIEAIAQAEAQRRIRPGARRLPRHVTIKHFEFAGEKIYFLNFVGEESPIAPAWCLTDDELIIATFPSHVKAYLSRSKDAKSIAEIPRVAKLLAADRGPMMIGYQDTKAMFSLVYPMIQIAAQFGCSEMQREGIDLNIAMFPSAASISRHLTSSVTSVTQTDAGIEMVSRQTVPIGVGSIVPPMMSFALLGQTFRRTSYKTTERRFDKAHLSEEELEELEGEGFDEGDFEEGDFEDGSKDKPFKSKAAPETKTESAPDESSELGKGEEIKARYRPAKVIRSQSERELSPLLNAP